MRENQLVKCEKCKIEIDIENKSHYVFYNGDLYEDSPIICLNCIDKI